MKKKIATLHKKLIDNCKDAKDLLKAADQLIPEGSKSLANQSTTTEEVGPENSITQTFDACRYDDKLIQNVYVLIHAIAIQEWNIFLDEVFGEAVMHHLKGGKLNKPPSGQLELSKLDAVKEIVKTRKNICDSAKERFGRNKYGEKIKTLRGLFGFKQSTRDDIMMTHVVIRNIFQHYRGKVRESDIKQIDKSKQVIEVVTDNGDVEKFGAGRKIVLSNPVIEKLLGTIEAYSKKFRDKAKTF